MDQSEAASIREAVTRRLNDYVEASLSLDAEKTWRIVHSGGAHVFLSGEAPEHEHGVGLG